MMLACLIMVLIIPKFQAWCTQDSIFSHDLASVYIILLTSVNVDEWQITSVIVQWCKSLAKQGGWHFLTIWMVYALTSRNSHEIINLNSTVIHCCLTEHQSCQKQNWPWTNVFFMYWVTSLSEIKRRPPFNNNTQKYQYQIQSTWIKLLKINK